MSRVLVIDNDRALTRALEIRLRAAGFEVSVAFDAHSGSRLAIRERPDVMLLDADIPCFSGLELHECLQYADRAKHIPVVYMSGNDSRTTRAEAFRNGASDFLSKPYEPAHLIRVLRDAMARSARCATRGQAS